MKLDLCSYLPFRTTVGSWTEHTVERIGYEKGQWWKSDILRSQPLRPAAAGEVSLTGI